MANQLSRALADAGLVSQKAVTKSIVQAEQRNLQELRKQQRRRHLQTDAGRIENYSSPAKFMEYVRQRLKDEGYSTELMNTIFREAHQFADAKLAQKHRSKMHAFLCGLKEKLEGTPVNKRQRILRDGRRAFAQMNINNL